MSAQLPASDFERQMSLAELVNRVLDRGAVITGEVTISVAGVDLLFVGLQLVLSATENLDRPPNLSRSLG
jgi:hypothetical protein